MITKQAKEYFGLGLVLAVLGVAVLSYVFISTHNNGTELIQANQAVLDRSADIKAYAEIEALMAKSAVERAAMEAILLTEEDTINFLANVESLALDNNVELETNTLVVEDLVSAQVLNVSFFITGTSKQVLSLLTQLETLPRVSYLTNVDITYIENVGLLEANAAVTMAVIMKKYDQ